MLMQTLNPQDIAAFSRGQGEPEWLREVRLAAWEQSLQLPNPTFRYGITISLNTKDLDLDALDYRQALQDGTAVRSIGAAQGVVAEDFRTAMGTHAALIRQYLFSVLPKAGNRIAAMHRALAIPMLVYVPKGVTLDLPLHIKTQVRAGVCCDHLLIIAEPESSVTIIDETDSHPQQLPHALHTKMVEVAVGERAVVNYTNVQNLHPSVFHFTEKVAAVAAQGRMNWLDCAMGGKLAQVAVTTSLDGEGAASNNWGMFFAARAQQFDLAATVRHNAPHTNADMLTKGAVTDHAKAIYRGLIKMERHARQSNGFQRADTLILSDTAEADNIPALEIDNADVKCSHASTIGQVDEEQLFYLQSRGISELEGRRMLVRSLFAPLIARVQVVPMQQVLQRIIEDRI